MNIDAFEKPCPMPLMMAKKEIDAGCQALSITVDNETAVENLTRLARTLDASIEVQNIEGGYRVSISQSQQDAQGDVDMQSVEATHNTSATQSSLVQICPAQQDYVVFVGKDHVGEGDPELGATLMKMALYTFAESEHPPTAMLFMNSGVKLVAGDTTQSIESVEKLQERGAQALVCGACLDFYGLKEALAVGKVSNMYDILEVMKAAPKAITL